MDHWVQTKATISSPKTWCLISFKISFTLKNNRCRHCLIWISNNPFVYNNQISVPQQIGIEGTNNHCLKRRLWPNSGRGKCFTIYLSLFWDPLIWGDSFERSVGSPLEPWRGEAPSTRGKGRNIQVKDLSLPRKDATGDEFEGKVLMR